MPETWTSHSQTSSEDIEQLRQEIRNLREKVEQTKQPAEGNGEPKEKGDEGDKGDKKNTGEEQKKTSHPLRNAIIIIVAVLAAAVALIWWLHARHFEDTDDAEVDGHISGIAARVAGTVTGVYFEENQFVQAGQVVADLDPRDYQLALEQARSQLRQAQAQTQAEQPNVPVTQVTNQTNIATTTSEVTSGEAAVAAAQNDYEAALAKVRESEANNAKAQTDVERYRPLAEKDEVPREQFDGVVATAKAQAATVAANQASAASALKQVDQRRAELEEARRRSEEAQKNAPRQVAIREANISSRQSGAQAARAQADQAVLNLSYCKIVTPVGGIVAKRTAEVGQYVTPGQQILLVMQTGDLWVTANFRETQLRRMRPNQSVRIHVDALDADFDGFIESLPAATGAVTSLLPPENATGNFVKIVQRLPVRIRFKQDQQGLNRLRPGMSVEPTVRVD
jgi:membrane fusion protein, multidrug efflux system